MLAASPGFTDTPEQAPSINTSDNGQSWERLQTGSNTSLNDGAHAGDRLVLVGNNGTLLIRESPSDKFQETLQADRLGLMGVVVIGPQTLLLVGEGGVVLIEGDAHSVEQGAGEQGVVEQGRVEQGAVE